VKGDRVPLLQPFRALRFAPERVPALAEVLAPPYDVISDSLRDALHSRHPYNIVRLELGYDTPQEDRYARAARLLNEWRNEGWLVEDAAPAFYVYEQSFRLPEGVRLLRPKAVYYRRALFAAVRLEPLGAATIFPHERTLSAPKADRLRLLRACRANLSPVCGVLSDHRLLLDEFLDEACGNRAPLCMAEEESGDTHTLWRVDGPNACARLSSALRNETMVIADGHHRYETALAYRDERRASVSAWSPSHPVNFVLAALVSAQSEGLVILPIHRLVRGADPAPIRRLPDLLRAAFDVSVLPFAPETENTVLDELLRHIQTSSQTVFGLYAGGEHFLEARLRDTRASDRQGEPHALTRLDVVRLHALLLKGVLGVDTDSAAGQEQVTYTIRPDEAIARVRGGTHQLAVFLKGPTMEDIEAAARAGTTMPQKSTYFHPKLPTGLLLRRLDDSGATHGP
jgi:uncharacterized protein (DUF1015 family)